MPSNKPRVTIYVTDENYARVKALASRPGKNVSMVMETALTAYFSQEREDGRDGAIIRRMDRLTRQMEVNKRNTIILSETVALYIRYFLTLMPEIDPEQKQAIQATGARRYDAFIETLRTVLGDGDRVLHTALDDIVVGEDAFFTKEDLMRLQREGRTQPQKGAA